MYCLQTCVDSRNAPHRWSAGCLCVILIFSGVLGGVAGCATSNRSSPASSSVNIAPLTLQTQIIGRSIQDRDIECITLGEGSTIVMLMATIHGDEPAGTPLLERLVREASTNPPWMRDRTLIILPNVNPDGFELNRRGNANGVDLNRNFPALSFTSRRRHGPEPLSEPESHALHALILEHRPHRIISLHQPINCIDYDGDGEALAHAMSRAIDEAHRLPVRKLGALPGSLGSFAGEDMGIPIITVEFGRSTHLLHEDELWARFGDMLIASITFE